MPDTVFHLRAVDTAAGPLALVTIDNGEDWTKPPSLGRSAFASAERLLPELEGGDWIAAVFTGKPFWFCAGADIDEFPAISPEIAAEGSRAGHVLFARIAAAAVSHRRCDQRGLPRGWARTRAPLHCPHGREHGAASRLPGSVPRPLSRVGRDPGDTAADRPAGGGSADRREPAAPESPAAGEGCGRARPRRPRARVRRARRRVDRVRARARRPPARASRARLVGAPDDHAPSPERRRGRRPRRDSRAVHRARPDRGRGHVER